MSDQLPPSSHSGGPQQPINPYESSRLGDVHATKQQIGKHSDFKFQSRLDWSDRRALLRSILPTRLVAVLSGLLWTKSLFDYAQYWSDAITGTEPVFHDAIGLVVIPFLGILWITQGFFGIYLCWLSWRYAERLQAVAGGRTRSWHEWSQLHLRTARLNAVVCILAISVESGNWLVARWDAAAAVVQ